MKPFLEVSHLNAWHGAAQILFDVSLHVGRGEVVALLGRNGAGKSSTLKAIMGLMPRREGELHFDGKISHKCNRSKLRAWVSVMCLKTGASSPISRY